MGKSLEVVAGRDVVVRFDAGKCVHSRNCVLGRPDVFVPNVQGDWIFPDRARPDEIAQLAANCPSGAITYERTDGGPQETAPKVNTLRIRENGPLALHAPSSLGGESQGYRLTLCRCGASRNKPFCDGSHGTAGFSATGEPPSKDSAPLDRRDGEVVITPQQDGPLKITGALELVSGTGRTLGRTTETYLCRCGASQNKPYCDGSHRKVGFVAP